MVNNIQKLVLVIIFIHSCLFVNAQINYGKIWLMGYGGDSMNKIEWEINKATFSHVKRKKSLLGNYSSICDNNGVFKFMSGGCSILDKNLNYLPNAKDLNPGHIYNGHCSNGAGDYPTWNGLVFLPMPNDTTKYVLFHLSMEQDSSQFFPPRKLNYSIVDATLNNGLGDVIEKNQTLLYNRLSGVGVQACRHGNGRDWWLITPQMAYQAYYTNLLSPSGIGGVKYQKINNDSLYQHDYAGQSVFSPDGTTYVRADPINGMSVLKFDRCTGKLSDLVYLRDTLKGICIGVAISPNSRYLYAARRNWLLQYDLQAEDIFKSQIVIDTFDGFKAPVETSFYQCLLAPNGKIYLGSTNGGYAMHTIHNPNEKGKACDFKQHDIIFKYIKKELPNLPNFMLGAKVGSPCEKALNNKEEKWLPSSILVFPNPAHALLSINLSQAFKTLTLTDLTGRTLQNIKTNPEQSEYQINTLTLENGLYFIRGVSENGKVVVARFIVVH